jgi:ribosomal protein S18 acetylase RimI-like enzyme
MTAGDYDDVRVLWDGTPGVGLNSVDDSREGIEKYLKRNPASCFVATEGGELVGSVMAGLDGRRGMIYHMGRQTAISARRCRKRLWPDAALDALRAEGITKVMLVVMKSNNDGNKFGNPSASPVVMIWYSGISE